MKAFITKAAFTAAMMATTFVAMAQDPERAFPVATSGTPVGTPIGLGLLALGAAAAGAYAIRRK